MDLVVPNFDAYREIGRGAMGEVYSAVHAPTGTPVALKFVRPTSDLGRTLLQSEILAMAKLNHPGLLYLYDTGMLNDQQTYWMAMELASGGSLEGWTPRDWKDMESLLEPILDALAYAHARGLIHRDLKPDNLLRSLSTDRRPGVKIADFGLAIVREAESKRMRAGSPSFMPPEQASRRWGAIGTWSDIYALGSTIWTFVTGQPPFTGTLRSVLHQLEHDPLPDFRPRFPVPQALQTTLVQMLAKSPEDRLRSVHEVRKGLWPDWSYQPITTAHGAQIPGLGAELLDRREWQIIGREAHQQALLDTLGAVQADRQPQVVLLAGPEGIGRRRLANWLTTTAEERGLATSVREPANPAEVKAMAQQQPVIAVCSASNPDNELRIAAMMSTAAPILILFIVRSSRDAGSVSSFKRVKRLKLAPLSTSDIHNLLRNELGLNGGLAMRIEAISGGVPGEAIRCAQDLVRSGRLHATPDGFDTDVADVSDQSRRRMAHQIIEMEGCTESEYRALRLLTVLGTTPSIQDWSTLLSATGLETPHGRVYRLLRSGSIQRNEKGYVWSDQNLWGALQSRPMSKPDLDAVDTFFSSRLHREESRYLFVMHCVATGQFQRARTLLLQTSPSLGLNAMARYGQAIQAIRPHMDGATATEHVRFLTGEMRATLNLISGNEALSLARALVEKLGIPTSPSPAYRDADTDALVFAWELASLIFAFEGQPELAERTMLGLEDSPRVLRSRALLAAERGHNSEAYALFSKAFRMTDDGATKARLANGIGSLLGRAGQFAEAIEWFEVAIEWMEPAHRYTPIQNLALTMLLQGRFREALLPAKQAMALAQANRTSSIPSASICLAIATLYEEEENLQTIADLTLFLAHTVSDASTQHLYVQLLQQSKPQLESSQVWVDAMIHTFTKARSKPPERPADPSRDLSQGSTFAVEHDRSTMAEWNDS